MSIIVVQREETVTVLRSVTVTVPDDFDINSEDFDTLVNEYLDSIDGPAGHGVEEDNIDATLDVIDVGPWDLIKVVA